MKLVELSNLSSFQKQCFDTLNSVALKNDLDIKNFYTDGISETYLVVEISSKDNVCVNAWIYVDECMFSCSEISYYFEKYAFDNANELISSFAEAILSVIRGIKPVQKMTSRINIFKGSKL
ncbi:MAG: hypothetical protein LBL65_08720 [Campylobacteraceae bacterium]|jgi:hypothetical protein|nr:hypothetical protein [Campylobacteraceae bacterium]